MRTLPASLLGVLLIATPACGAEKEEAKSTDRAEQFKSLKADWQKAMEQFQKSVSAAKTQEERQAAFEKRPNPAEYVARLKKLVDANPSDDLSCEMLTFAVLGLRDASPKVIDALAEHHAKNPKIANLLGAFAYGAPEPAVKLLEKVLAENEDKMAKGLACVALAVTAVENENTAEAQKLFERVEKEFADIKVGRGTAGDMAKPFLFEIRNLAVGKKAPEAESTDLDGKKVKLSDYQGKVVVLDIWATWCGPCRAMIPHEREMVKKFDGKPFALISISADDKKETLEEFLKKEPMPWTHWWAGRSGAILKDWNVRFFPTIYVIDAKGVIRAKHKRGKELEDVVEKLLGSGS